MSTLVHDVFLRQIIGSIGFILCVLSAAVLYVEFYFEGYGDFRLALYSSKHTSKTVPLRSNLFFF